VSHRLDATRPSFGEMGLLSNVTATLGQGAWKKAIVVLTHANAGKQHSFALVLHVPCSRHLDMPCILLPTVHTDSTAACAACTDAAGFLSVNVMCCCCCCLCASP
jgi:hypothetical protein